MAVKVGPSYYVQSNNSDNTDIFFI